MMGLIGCIWIFKLEATRLKVLHPRAWDKDDDDGIDGVVVVCGGDDDVGGDDDEEDDGAVGDDDDDDEEENLTDNISPLSPGFTVERYLRCSFGEMSSKVILQKWNKADFHQIWETH